MNSTLQTINSLHNLNIKKEDFNSFKNVKQYFDKFIKIILMDSPIYVSALESAEKYLNEDGKFPYVKSFYETFKLSDDGYDSIDIIILARYCSLLRYILEKIDSDSKMKFNIMDIVEPKFTRLVSFLSKLSVFANFIQAIDKNVKQIIRICENTKRENDKAISNIKLRKQQLLTEGDYDELNEYFHILNDIVSTRKREIIKRNEILKEKRARNMNLCAENDQLKRRLSELREKTSKITAENDAIQKRINKDPEEMDEEIFKLRNEYNKESEKLQILFNNHANLKYDVKQAPIISSKIQLYSSHLSFIKEAMGNYEHFHHEKLKMETPEIEINNHLLKVNENLKREINTNKEKFYSQINNKNNLKMENMRAQEHIGDLKEQLLLLKLSKQEKVKEKLKYETEIKNITENFPKSEKQYRDKLESIEKNFNQSLKELEEHYVSK